MSSSNDFFGIDDIIIDDLDQVQIGAPESGALARPRMGLRDMLSLVFLRRQWD